MYLSLNSVKKYAVFVMLLAIPAVLLAKAGERTGSPVSFQTPDGVIITGTYHAPAGPRMKTFILLHGLGSTNEEWQSFAVHLVRAGYGFLAYDARGHGKSVFTRDGKQLSYENFVPSQWNLMIQDVGSAVSFLMNEKKIQEKRIGLIGASMGANVSMLYAASNEAVPMVVLLSPGVNYVLFNISNAVSSFQKRPVAIAVSPNDTYAYQSSQLLFRKIEMNKRAVLLTAAKGHGVEMFDGRFERRLLQWIAKY
ncbi:MAG: alpha/beta fold hydrolase [Elusimicrobiota bacterium]